ncbi:glucokinase [Thecamonas trahens ATCC 50062]|uniref:Glucokinase n=1 Tax=Thecamonas trahens ATCC 50062 TaxID=461836 RepID=A0A0L0DLX5_THETB|nr:glucokinase [Thecamonas trahens ATCC 50062]KNC53255.1 glucokinase [Thecamonas trahens ATCC 50062]|eukprot:XP_013754519.1 glucokinase [Thecamonas trahens ATCC 50062]
MSSGPMHILAGDIGGTNTRLVLYAVADATSSPQRGQSPPGEQVYLSKYANEDHTSFVDVVRKFMAAAEVDPSSVAVAALAVAGPVDDGRAVLSNLESWCFAEDVLETELGIAKVLLANDFLALGYGLLTLGDSDLLTLQDVAPRPGAPIACVGAGTGLGECFLAAAGPDADYVAFPSEGGHAEFAPRNELELEMLAFLKDRFSEKNRISVERVVSGPGLANIYDFLRAKFPHAVCDAADARILAADAQRGALIAEAAAEGDELCSRALDILFSAYGSEVGVAALKWLPYGGLYVAGGLAPKNINRIRGETEFPSTLS